MLSRLVAASLLPSLGYGASLTFFEGKGCSGQALFGGKFDKSLPCLDVSEHAPTNSTSVEQLMLGQTVHFYSDSECQIPVYSTSSDICYVQTGADVASVRIDALDAPKKRASGAKVSTTDLVVYQMEDYSDETAISPRPDLPYSDFFIAYGLDIAAGTVTVGSIAIGCFSASNGGALSITGCILGPLATGLVWLSGYFKGRAGRSSRGEANQALGQYNAGTPGPKRKRELLDSLNADYLSQAMDWSGMNSSHVGYMLHDLGDGEQTSPVYEFAGGDGANYHIAAFYSQDSEDFVHRVYQAQHAELNKRAGPGYLNVRWNSGGFDFSLCNYNSAASTSDFDNKDINDLYNTYYQELECLVSADQLKDQTAVYFEIFNGQRNLISGVEMVFFDGDSGSAVSPLMCNTQTTQSSSCVY